MIDADRRRVEGGRDALAVLQAHVETLDTQELTAQARSLGIHPPDDRPGWYVTMEYGPDLTEHGLFWVGPDDE